MIRCRGIVGLGRLRAVVLLSMPLLVSCGRQESPWTKAEPASQGMDARAFEGWADSVQRHGTEALLVIRNDRLIHEWYAPDRSPDRRHYTASLAKGAYGGLALALLLDRGRIRLEDPAWRFLPESEAARWRSDSLRSRITVDHLASHRSGLEDAEEEGVPHGRLSGWKGTFWERGDDPDPVRIALERPRVEFPPGGRSSYSSVGFAVLSQVLAAALEEEAASDLRAFLREALFDPIGVARGEWSMGYGSPFQVDGREVWGVWGGGMATPRALARLGRLLLRRGDWEDRELLSPRAVETLIEPRGAALPEAGSPLPAAGWWSNANGVWGSLPRDAFAAMGAEHQVLLVVPSLDLVVVRMGGDLRVGQEEGFWEAARDRLFGSLGEAFLLPEVPRSLRLAGAWSDPTSATVCRARGSDNWPLTWTERRDLFGAYGDGWGFEPGTERKLSQGFVRIQGMPPAFEGVNVPSPSGETLGDGPVGPKASGLLDVNGTLHLWVRNTDNARLAWSEDGGRSWEWGFRLTESFGAPTFLQFGPGYRDARDEYVYTFSHDGPSAYEAADAMVLARVHRDSVRLREAWTFFAGRQDSGEPRWSPTIPDRAPVLELEGGALRSEVVHDRALGLHLMAVGFDMEGGWGLFEAPEPWGPWSLIYATRRWDVPRTHSYRIPTKWILDEGRTLHLVYSGFDHEGVVSDAFCVRRLRLTPMPELFQEPTGPIGSG